MSCFGCTWATDVIGGFECEHWSLPDVQDGPEKEGEYWSKNTIRTGDPAPDWGPLKKEDEK
jgi:hypothetical protein